MQKTLIWSMGQEDSLERKRATLSLVWEIPWREEPGELQAIGLQRLRHNLITKQQQQMVANGSL